MSGNEVFCRTSQSDGTPTTTNNMEKANLTLYTAIGNPSRISVSVKEHFQEVTKSISDSDNQLIITFRDNSQLKITINHHQDQANFIASHLEGMANYFSQVETSHQEVKNSVLRQIQCFNCVAGIVFEIDDNDERTNYLMNSLFDVAKEINGYLLYPNMQIFNGQGQLVFSAKGESELTTFAPTANADLLDQGRGEETAADQARRKRSINQLEEKGIPYLEQLRCEFTEQEARIKSREEMVKRAVALFAVAVYSEVLLSENPDREEAIGYINKLDEIYGIGNDLTPAEKAYLADPQPEQSTCIQFVWRYECCGVLLWASGITEELPYPSDICDVPVIASIFWQHKGLDDLMSKGFARTDAEILDAADLTLRYDWACVDARIHQKENPASLDGGVVMERHYAFNWITGADGATEWDDIRPNT